MYKNVKTITREEYKELLDRGLTFKDWSLYEPQNNPSKTYYIVKLGKSITVNKTEITKELRNDQT